jgi:hypothetical protein
MRVMTTWVQFSAALACTHTKARFHWRARPKLHNSCFFFAHLTSALGRLNNRARAVQVPITHVCVSAHASP